MAAAVRRCCPLLLLVRLLVQALVTSATEAVTYRIIPPASPFNLTEAENKTVIASVQVPEKHWNGLNETQYVLQLSSYHPEVAAVSSEVFLRKEDLKRDENSQYSFNTTFTVYGNSLGKTGMRVRLVTAESWNETDEWWKPKGNNLSIPATSEALDISVLRSKDDERLTKIFVFSVILLVILGNIMMGCEIDVNVVLETIKKPVAPAIGLFAQFFIMPLLAIAIAKSIFVPRGLYSMALGLFITGCSPGGGASNFWTLLLDGNVNLSVTMTFLSTLASLVLMPFWINTFGGQFLQGFSAETQIKVPTMNIVRTLCSLIIPILVGVAIQKFKPKWAAKSRKCMRPFIIFVLVFVVVFGAISNWYMFRMMSIPALLGGLLLPWCGFMFGCFTSIILRRTPPDVTAIAIETGIQNTGIAIIMLKAAFHQPDADIGAVIPVIVACFTPAPLLLGAAVHTAVKRFKRRNAPTDQKTVTLELSEAAPTSNLLVDPSKLESQPLPPVPFSHHVQ